MAHDKHTIKVWLKGLAEKSKGNPDAITEAEKQALIRALLFMYNRQTADEQSSQCTAHHNGMGFSGADAEFLSSVAEWAKRKGTISGKQAHHVAKRLARYSGQLAEMVKKPEPPPMPTEYQLSQSILG